MTNSLHHYFTKLFNPSPALPLSSVILHWSLSLALSVPASAFALGFSDQMITTNCTRLCLRNLSLFLVNRWFLANLFIFWGGRLTLSLWVSFLSSKYILLIKYLHTVFITKLGSNHQETNIQDKNVFYWEKGQWFENDLHFYWFLEKKPKDT